MSEKKCRNCLIYMAAESHERWPHEDINTIFLPRLKSDSFCNVAAAVLANKNLREVVCNNGEAYKINPVLGDSERITVTFAHGSDQSLQILTPAQEKIPDYPIKIFQVKETLRD